MIKNDLNPGLCKIAELPTFFPFNHSSSFLSVSYGTVSVLRDGDKNDQQ